MEPKVTPNERIVCMIDIGLIRMDRYPMNPSTLSLIDYLREGGEVPAIKVVKHPKGGYIIRDGRHRVLAHKLLGRAEIKAKFSSKAILKPKQKINMTEKQKIEVDILEELWEECKGVHSEYIIALIEEKIDIIKNGI